jgi:hypothetical protein
MLQVRKLKAAWSCDKHGARVHSHLQSAKPILDQRLLHWHSDPSVQWLSGCMQWKVIMIAIASLTMISGSLSPRHGVSLGCGWRNGLRIWRVAANTLNKQSRTAEKGWSSSWGLGEVLTTPHHKKLPCYEPLYKASDLDRFFGTT